MKAVGRLVNLVTFIDETFTVALDTNRPLRGLDAGDPTSVTITIRDDDRAGNESGSGSGSGGSYRGQGAVSYRVFGLPAGLSFDPATRTISGTPTTATNGAIEIAYTAKDSTRTIKKLAWGLPALAGRGKGSGLNDGAVGSLSEGRQGLTAYRLL